MLIVLPLALDTSTSGPKVEFGRENPEVSLAAEGQENDQNLGPLRLSWKGVSALYAGSLPFIL